MRVVIQRVLEAGVKINDDAYRSIANGLLVLACFEELDTDEDLVWMSNKIAALRIFSDEHGKMNLSINETNGEVLLISQFTLYASTAKGNRPSYLKAAKPDIAIPLYNKFADLLKTLINKGIQAGEFGADMKVNLINDGPVTITIDSKNKE